LDLNVAIQVGPCPRADHDRLPAHPGPDDELVLVGHVLHGLAIPDVQSLRTEPRRLLEQSDEITRPQRKDPKACQQFLLVQAVGQFVARGSPCSGSVPGRPPAVRGSSFRPHTDRKLM
jgi:hypothetical protein